MRISALTYVGGRLSGRMRRHAVLGAFLILAGCSGPPVVDVVGSYFPAWLLCSLIGISVAVLVRQLLVLAELEGSLMVPLFTHAAVALTATLLVWLIWFGH